MKRIAVFTIKICIVYVLPCSRQGPFVGFEHYIGLFEKRVGNLVPTQVLEHSLVSQ